MAGVVFLMLPAAGALLIAAAGGWGALSQAASPWEAIGGIGLAFVFVGFGAYLLWLWVKSLRRVFSKRRRETGSA